MSINTFLGLQNSENNFMCITYDIQRVIFIGYNMRYKFFTQKFLSPAEKSAEYTCARKYIALSNTIANQFNEYKVMRSFKTAIPFA